MTPTIRIIRPDHLDAYNPEHQYNRPILIGPINLIILIILTISIIGIKR